MCVIKSIPRKKNFFLFALYENFINHNTENNIITKETNCLLLQFRNLVSLSNQNSVNNKISVFSYIMLQ